MGDALQVVQDGVPADAGGNFQAGGGELPQGVDDDAGVDGIRRKGSPMAAVKR